MSTVIPMEMSQPTTLTTTTVAMLVRVLAIAYGVWLRRQPVMRRAASSSMGFPQVINGKGCNKRSYPAINKCVPDRLDIFRSDACNMLGAITQSM